MTKRLVLRVVAAAALCVGAASQASWVPVAYYPFDDAADPVNVLDFVGSSNGVTQGGAIYTANGAGHTGLTGDYAMDFGVRGDGRRVLVAGSGFAGDAVANNAITISLWQLASGQPASDSSFWATSPTAGGGQRGAQAHIPWGDGTIYWDTGGCCGSNTRLTTGAGGPFDAEWHHYVFVKDGNHKEIWVDGVIKASHNSATAPLLPFSQLRIGDGSASYGGLVDDFAVWDSGLPPEAIQLLAAGAPPMNIPEPATLTLLALGGLGLLVRRRR